MDASQFDRLTIDVVKKVAPAVVSIGVSKYLPKVSDINPVQLFNPFAFSDIEDGAQRKVKVGGGSGFIAHASGIVLTNKHVVFDTEAEYTVTLHDGTEYPATVICRDPVRDIAMLKITGNASSLPHATLAAHDRVELGQTVLAIGNALGLFSNSVSKGIVSGLARSISATLGSGEHTENLRGVIQTDVAINQGNSGGPLINLDGHVVGINTAVISGAQNIGFALPISWARADLNDVILHGRIIKPYLGLMYVTLTPEIVHRYRLGATTGALVLRDHRPDAVAVIPGSPAQEAGIQENDIITHVNKQPMEANQDLMDLLQSHTVGEVLHLTLMREGKEHTASVTLQERKA